jgi:cell wall-associated NlpC family hydrolase
MKNFTTISSFFLILQAFTAVNAHAERVAHRPWGASRSSDLSLTALESDRTSLRTSTSHSHKASSHSARRGELIAQQAVSYKGSRYRFGGDTKRGLDCSGLVRRVYDDLNLKQLPHTSSGLYKMGTPVKLNELRAGDLVFFKNTYKRGVSHVGVYAGENRFVHAQNRRHGVTLTSLADPYYQLHYAGARRLY